MPLDSSSPRSFAPYDDLWQNCKLQHIASTSIIVVWSYDFGGSECSIRHEAKSQLKCWTAGTGASMQRNLKPND
ncbi:hypothetical protein T03_813 [Trichinella britovi]|uniref:Uncharacterized protein n=1 Tax=Trichinella britovi TaxID=45882 RepID=A0A0V1CRL8_TRIBR|nr:hypothetical protein T03_813 [Trichinella britovi]